MLCFIDRSVNEQLTLQSERLVLRSLTLQDAPLLSRLAGRRGIADTTISIPHLYSDRQTRQWIAGLARGSAICQPYKHIQKYGMITAKAAAETHPPYARVERRNDLNRKWRAWCTLTYLEQFSDSGILGGVSYVAWIGFLLGDDCTKDFARFSANHLCDFGWFVRLVCPGIE